MDKLCCNSKLFNQHSNLVSIQYYTILSYGLVINYLRIIKNNLWYSIDKKVLNNILCKTRR